MAGFFSYAVGGIGFLVVGVMESLCWAFPLPRSLPFVMAGFLSVLSAGSCVISAISSSPSADPIGSPLPLSSLPVAALFFLFSLSSLLPLPLPAPLLQFLSFSAFFQEFLLFRLRSSKDPDGLENRYFDLLLVPILVCAVSSLLAISRPRSPFPRLARAAGLALHGSWLLQMAFSLFTSFMPSGCSLLRRSTVNFTVLCRAKAQFHRAGAIATLQFNCHLAALVSAAVMLRAILARKNGGYKPINRELHRMNRISTSNFILDSDEDEETSLHFKQIDAVSPNAH